MNNADLIVKTLKAAGIDYGFGIPSGNVLPLMEAMRTGDMEFVLTAHEGSAGFSADVMGRLTEKPGLCIATLGPGATNLSTGVGNAWLDRSPLIAITCNLNTDQLGRRIQMYIDHEALFKPITKASFALRPGNIVETLEKAVKMALSEPRGPVHIDLPEDVALAAATETAPRSITQAAYSAAPADSALAKAEELIAKAKYPIAVLGSSAMRMQNMDLLRDFVERNGIPFATTTMAKGLIDEDHALSIGCIERARRQVQRAFLRGADLIIGLGYDTIEVEYEAWIGDVPLLQIDIEAVDTDGSVEIACEVTGDLDSSLSQLNAFDPAQNDWTDDIISSHRKAFHDSLRPPSENFAPHHVIDIVRSALPREGILTFDVGAHTHQIASQWTAHSPRSFLITNGWSSMGFGLPSAVSAKLARPDLPVVCILGDGCFQMTCG
nr:thiamine pyrophosphate-binding protein [Alphaproteobacteria bacterium]